MDVDITTFVTPHFFFVTEKSVHKREDFLTVIQTIKNGPTEVSNLSFDINEIVGVCYDNEFVRAKIENMETEVNIKIYYCWLLDYGFMIKSDKVFKLSNEVKKYEPLAKQVLLDNIAYIKNPELGINENTHTTVPSLEVSTYCKNILSGYSKLHLKVLSYSAEIIIGELFIYKQNKILNLSEELIKRGLLVRDSVLFECLKKEAACYMMNHLNLIYHSAKNIQAFNKVEDHKVIWEDSDTGSVLENGRRRFKIKSSLDQPEKQIIGSKMNTDIKLDENLCNSGSRETSESSCVQKIKINNPRLLLKLKENALLKKNSVQIETECLSHKTESLPVSKMRVNLNIMRKRIADLKGQREKHEDIKNTMRQSSTFPQRNKSPFSDIIYNQNKSDLTVLPSGISLQKKSTKNRLKINKNSSSQSNTSVSVPSDSDCPTVEVIKKSSPPRYSAYRPKTTDSSSTTSEKEQRMLTKTDFCKLLPSGCNCKDCRMACEDEDWESSSSTTQISKIFKTKAGPIIKPARLFKEGNETDVDKVPIVTVSYDNMTSLQKLGVSKVLVHGESIPQPAKFVSAINIDLDIYNSISRLNYKEAKKIQQYAFPAISDSQHVFMINNSKTGKTMAYLPIIISFIKQKNKLYGPLLKLSGGPMAVILCSNSRKCEEIYDLTKLILQGQKCRVNLVTYPGHGNISNVEILITIPNILSSLIISRAINFKRLCHFVLEDADKILNLHKELIDKFLFYSDQVLENRHCPISIQVIVCAEHWTYEIEHILKRLNKIPLVCIGNYLEAALYGKINFTMKFLEDNRKNQQLKDILGDVFKNLKSIIISNSEDISNIEAYLLLNGIEYITINGDMTQEDIQYCEDEWNKCPSGKYPVLICTDTAYNTLSVTNVSVLVHYSLPKTWTQFVKRFSCLLENIGSPLRTKTMNHGMTVSSFVFIDEYCEPKMSKFYKLLKSSGLQKYLSEQLKTYFEGVETRIEANKIQEKIELCDKLKIFGYCSSIQCLKRHVVSKEIDVSDFLPKNGYIKFKIKHMTSTTTASIKLLEHLDLNGTKVDVFEDYIGQIEDLLEKDVKYTLARNLNISDFYLYKEANKYFRCKLVENTSFSLVFLLDTGSYRRAESNQLYFMPQELKNIPQQCFEVYFANLVPPHDDTTFCRLSRNKTQLLVEVNCSKVILKAAIKLQLADNLWLSDVCEEREMFDKELPSIGFQLTKELIQTGLAVHKANIIDELYTVVRSAGIELPPYLKVNIQHSIVEEQMKPQWAFLDVDEVTKVMFSCGVNPGEFYVRNAKFHKQLLDLEEYILKEIQKPFYPTLTCLDEGKCYLAKDEYSDNYSRVLLLKKDQDQVHVFSVDYGDILIIKSSDLKYLRNDMILRLPFQAIQCSLYGIQPIEPNKWTDETIALLYDKCFEPGTDIYRALYAKVESKSDNIKIERQNSYIVLIKDGYNESKVLLNTLLIECGFVISDGNTITDFSIDAFYQTQDEIISEDDVNKPENYLDENNDFGNLEDFELIIGDMEKFLTELNIHVSSKAVKQTERVICDTSNKCIDADLPAIKAVPVVDFLTPFVLWFQTNSHIKLTIQIQDINDCIIKLLRNKILYFSAEKNGKKYKVNLILFNDVEKTFQYTILGSEIRVTLRKCTEAEWPRLLLSTAKNKKVRYDVMKIKDEDKPKRFLDLEMDESSSSDEDGPVYYVCSDRGSEYDYDIQDYC